MPSRRRFQQSFLSCLSVVPSPPPSPPPEENREAQNAITPPRAVIQLIGNNPSTKNSELACWSRAMEAAQLRAHFPRQGDVLPPWAYAKETIDVCTVEPFTSERVTLFLRSTLSGPELARKLESDFFEGMQLTVKDIANKNFESHYPVGPSTTLLLSENGQPFLVVETAPGEHMYGNTLMLTTGYASEALETLEYLDSIFPEGFSCTIAHDAVVTSMDTAMGTMRLIRRTGVERTQTSAENLATVFELEAEGAPSVQSGKPYGIAPKVVARCVLGYRDASVWSSVGPTIQTIMVRTDYQRGSLVQLLFNAVEEWFTEFWTLNTRYGNRAFKATHLRDFIVDRAPREEDGTRDSNDRDPQEDPEDMGYELTDKMFFYEMMHFLCNNPFPADPRVKHGGAIPEAHAIRFYPPTGTPVPLPTVYFTQPYVTKGWRSCDNCRVLEETPGMLNACSECNLPRYWRAQYCSRACQLKDWSVHRLWCGKTYEEVCSGMKILEESMRAGPTRGRQHNDPNQGRLEESKV